MPISAMITAGDSALTVNGPMRSSSGRSMATATIRPRVSMSGMWSTPGRNNRRRSSPGVSIDADVYERFATATDATSMFTRPCSAIQRRRSPSVKTPSRTPCSVVQKMMRDLFALIFSSARRSGSSEYTT